TSTEPRMSVRNLRRESSSPPVMPGLSQETPAPTNTPIVMLCRRSAAAMSSCSDAVRPRMSLSSHAENPASAAKAIWSTLEVPAECSKRQAWGADLRLKGCTLERARLGIRAVRLAHVVASMKRRRVRIGLVMCETFLIGCVGARYEGEFADVNRTRPQGGLLQRSMQSEAAR